MIRSKAVAFVSVLAGATVVATEPASADHHFKMSDAAVHTHTSPFGQDISCSVEYFYLLNPNTHQLRIVTNMGLNQQTGDSFGCRDNVRATHTYVRANYLNTDGQQVQSRWYSGAFSVDVTIANVSELHSGSEDPAIKTDHYATWDECIANCTSTVYSLMGGAGKN